MLLILHLQYYDGAKRDMEIIIIHITADFVPFCNVYALDGMNNKCVALCHESKIINTFSQP